ncbi:MAG: precorrin-2 C(20)-methyltransferase [Pseudomonadota bacterium]
MAPVDAGDAMEPCETMSKGKLYGVGLGPGDPDLMTVRAHRLISNARVIAYPKLAGADSFARSIAKDAIDEGAQEIVIEVPMTTERAPAQVAYDRGAEHIKDALEAGDDVVCLCEGDPFFYGSFMYLFARLSTDFEVEVVPGVSSVMACAARAGLPLAARNERLTVLPGPLPENELRLRIEGAESVAIMKVGRHLPKIRGVIEALGYSKEAIYVERASLAEEKICLLADAPETAPYFSMILLTKGADPWL